MERVTIYDTTLRDGCQAEGVAFSVEDKLRVARRLDEIGVAYIEAAGPTRPIPAIRSSSSVPRTRIGPRPKSRHSAAPAGAT